MWSLWKVMKCGPVSSCTILVYETQRELTASILQQPKQNLAAGQLDTYHSKKQNKTKHRQTFNWLNLRVFGFGNIYCHSTLCRLLCFYIYVCICTMSLYTYEEFLFRLRIVWKRQMKLFWANWKQYCGFTSEIYSHAWKSKGGDTPAFFSLAS